MKLGRITGQYVTAFLLSRVVLASQVTGATQVGHSLAPVYDKLVREQATSASYALINNVACGRCNTTVSFLEESRTCLPQSVHLKTPTCMKQEQYLPEYGDNPLGILRCYVKMLRMGLEQLYCLLKANETNPTPDFHATRRAAHSSPPGARPEPRRSRMLLLTEENSRNDRDRRVDPNGTELRERDDGVHESLPSSEGLHTRGNHMDKKGTEEDSTVLREKEYDEDIELWRQDYWRRRRYDRGKYDYNNREAATQEYKSGRQRQLRRKGREAEEHENVSGGGKHRQIQPYRRRSSYVTGPAPEHDRRTAGRRGHKLVHRRPENDKFAGEEKKRFPRVRSKGRQRIYSTRYSYRREEYDPSIRHGFPSTTRLGTSERYRKTYTSDVHARESLPSANTALRKQSEQGPNNHWEESELITEAFAEELPRRKRIMRRRRTEEDQEEHRVLVVHTIRVKHQTGSWNSPWNTEDATREPDDTLEIITEEGYKGKRGSTREPARERRDEWYDDGGDGFNGFAPFRLFTAR